MRAAPFLASVSLSLCIGIVALPVCAQAHGGGGVSAGHAMASASHAGSVGHVGPARAPLATLSGGARPGGSALRPGYSAHQFNQGSLNQGSYGGNWTSAGFIPSHSGYGQSGHDHNRHVGYGYGAVGFLPYGYLDSGVLDYSYDQNDPNQQPANATAGGYADNTPPPVPYAAQGEQGYAPYGPAGYGEDNSRIPYNPGGSTHTAQNGAAYDGLGHPKITLIFRDGRAPMKIQNYAMSQTRIFVRDNDTDRDIAISDLDVPATMAANDQAGVDFELPVKH